MAEGQTAPTKHYDFAQLTKLAKALDSKQSHTSFGKLPLSKEKTSENFAFGRANRESQAKVYLGELTVKENVGKKSPGPVYQFEESIKYPQEPLFSFGNEVKLGEIKPKYDFYNNDMFLDDPINADLKRKPRVNAPKIGTEPRMPATSLEQNPGPAQYQPKDKPEFKKNALYTFGYRRGGGANDCLKLQVSTPMQVGPGRYVPEASVNPSTKEDFPRWSLPKAGRMPPEVKKNDKNQTYDMRKHFGKQAISKNRSSASCHFGTSTRGHTKKEGVF